jgi:M3 family oligoendopeptidase
MEYAKFAELYLHRIFPPITDDMSAERANIKFSEMPYTRPDMQALKEKYEQLIQRFGNASDAEGQLRVIEDWNNLRLDIATNMSVSSVRFSQNVKDEWAKEERAFLDKNAPDLSEWNRSMSECIVNSEYRDQIEEVWGKVFVQKLELSLQTFSAEIKENMRQESEAGKRYAEILASAEIEFDGEKYNLSSLERKLLSTDRETRKKAQQKRFEFQAANAEELDSIYDTLVKTRAQMAHKLGFSNYVELAYKELGRIEYGPEQVAIFRRQIEQDVVPIVHRLRKEQAKRLNIESLRFHDEMLHFTTGNPVAAGSPDWIVERATEMYSDLSPETDEFFQMMRENELMDLVTRPNKSVGGYCTSFPKYGLPFIFSNFNGTTHDVEVLTHEAGHAFQAYLSRTHKPIEYRFPSYEACEIHSMGMEYLTWPWMDKFFGEHVEKFKFYHLVRSIMFLPYACAVDEFQHWVYENPEVKPADRLAFWRSMEQKYLPWRVYEDMPMASEGRVWQFQRHIYESPFYYIDYALAQICALQIWAKSSQDLKSTMTDYLKICEIGGSQTFLDIVKSGNMISPFQDGCVKQTIGRAIEWIDARTPGFMPK